MNPLKKVGMLLAAVLMFITTLAFASPASAFDINGAPQWPANDIAEMDDFAEFLGWNILVYPHVWTENGFYVCGRADNTAKVIRIYTYASYGPDSPSGCPGQKETAAHELVHALDYSNYIGVNTEDFNDFAALEGTSNMDCPTANSYTGLNYYNSACEMRADAHAQALFGPPAGREDFPGVDQITLIQRRNVLADFLIARWPVYACRARQYYRMTLNREPDTIGFDYWLAGTYAESFNINTMPQSFINGVEYNQPNHYVRNLNASQFAYHVGIMAYGYHPGQYKLDQIESYTAANGRAAAIRKYSIEGYCQSGFGNSNSYSWNQSTSSSFEVRNFVVNY